jgi:hypothetical protein
MIHSLCLPICLRVISGAIVKTSANQLVQTLPEPRCPLCSSIIYDANKCPVKSENVFDIQICQLLYTVVNLDRYKVSYLG